MNPIPPTRPDYFLKNFLPCRLKSHFNNDPATPFRGLYSSLTRRTGRLNYCFAQLTGLFIFLLYTHTLSQYYNNSQYIIGEEAAGLAGAYTAIADNSTALWYNPAGLACIQKQNVNISGSAYSYLSSKTPGYISYSYENGRQENIDFKASDFSIITTTLIYGRNMGPGTSWAFGLFVPFQDNLNQIAEGKITENTHTLEINAESQKTSKYYLGLLGIGKQVLPWWRLGAALKTGYYSQSNRDEIRIMVHSLDSGNSDGFVLVRSETSEQIISGSFQFGGQINLSPKIIFAGNFSMPHITLWGTQVVRSVDWPLEDNQAFSTNSEELNLNFPQVFRGWEWNFGLGYVYNATRLDFDWIVIPPGPSKPNWIVNLKLGAQLPLKDRLIWRMGLSTDFNQTPELPQNPTALQAQNLQDRAHYITGASTLSFAKIFALKEEGKTTQNTLWSTFGISYKMGWGQSIAQNFDSSFNSVYKRKDVLIHNIQFILAENISF